MATAPVSPVQIVRDPATASTLLQPPRLRILELLSDEDSATGVARKIGLPRQQVNYHLRSLEAGGLVELVREQRKGNCVERIVRATATSYVISPEALGNLGNTPPERRDRFSAAYLVGVAARAIRDLAILGRRAAKAGKRLATLTIETEVRFRSAEERNAFAEELANTLARLTAKYHDEQAPSGRLFRCWVGAYPAITRTEDDASDSTKLE
jgi:DNA-binding transcriptional ArsR family regulator